MSLLRTEHTLSTSKVPYLTLLVVQAPPRTTHHTPCFRYQQLDHLLPQKPHSVFAINGTSTRILVSRHLWHQSYGLECIVGQISLVVTPRCLGFLPYLQQLRPRGPSPRKPPCLVCQNAR